MRHQKKRTPNTISAIFYNFGIVISTPLRRIKCFLLLLFLVRFFRRLLFRQCRDDDDDHHHHTTIWWETYSANKLFRRNMRFFFSFPSVRSTARRSLVDGFLWCDGCLFFLSCSLFSRFAWISFVFIYCFSSHWTCDAPAAHREFIGKKDSAFDVVALAVVADEEAGFVCAFIRWQ